MDGPFFLFELEIEHYGKGIIFSGIHLSAMSSTKVSKFFRGIKLWFKPFLM